MSVAYFAFLISIPVIIVLVTMIRLMRRHRFQFSLRTLLIFVTAVAVLLSVITSWNYWFKAQIVFLDPASPLVAKWTAPPVIIEEKGFFNVTYRPQHRGIGEILNLTEKAPQRQFPSSSKGLFDHLGQLMNFESDSRDYHDEKLTTIKKFDVLQKSCFTIQGIVKDAAGNPVPGATLELMGVYINSTATRNGTFLMPMQVPAQAGYYLRIRYVGNSMDTQRFPWIQPNRNHLLLSM